MAEEIKNLIEKIQQEGIKAAEEKARQIEEQAGKEAQVILEKAKQEAQGIIADARDRAAKTKASTDSTLQQAGRDLLVSLKKEINAVLERLLILKIRQALSPQELTRIISALVKDYTKEEKGNLVISLNKDDLQKLEKAFLAELPEEIRKGLILRPSEDIAAGFTISYDTNKSYYDFSDKALAEYIGSYLKPNLAEILKSV